jgi:hypothetical protein
MIVPSWIELYARRCDESIWGDAHKDWAEKVADHGLQDFVIQFNYVKTQKMAPRAKPGNDIYVVYAI